MTEQIWNRKHGELKMYREKYVSGFGCFSFCLATRGTSVAGLFFTFICGNKDINLCLYFIIQGGVEHFVFVWYRCWWQYEVFNSVCQVVHWQMLPVDPFSFWVSEEQCILMTTRRVSERVIEVKISENSYLVTKYWMFLTEVSSHWINMLLNFLTWKGKLRALQSTVLW